MTELKALLERVEKAEGADRELDWLIAEHFGDVPRHTVREIGWDYDWYRHPGEFGLRRARDSEGRSIESWAPFGFTTSIDAALALVERCLPGWHIDRMWTADPSATATNARSLCGLTLMPNMDNDDGWDGGKQSAGARTLPLAILAALLKALIQEQSHAR